MKRRCYHSFTGALSVGLAIVAFAIILALAAGVDRAWPHAWYTGKTDPVIKVSCCGGTDCAPIPAEDVREVSGGYVYIPTGEFIEHARVQPAHDWEFHRCVFLQDQTNWQTGEVLHRKGTTRCFFAPPGSM